MAGGLVEALFLVLVTRAAFSITEGRSDSAYSPDRDLSVGAAMGVTFALVALRLGLAVWSNAQAARLTSEVVATIRAELAHAFLQASWPVQQQARSGQLQELLTSFSQHGSELVGGLTVAATSVFNLIALLCAASHDRSSSRRSGLSNCARARLGASPPLGGPSSAVPRTFGGRRDVVPRGPSTRSRSSDSRCTVLTAAMRAAEEEVRRPRRRNGRGGCCHVLSASRLDFPDLTTLAYRAGGSAGCRSRSPTQPASRPWVL